MLADACPSTDEGTRGRPAYPTHSRVFFFITSDKKNYHQIWFSFFFITTFFGDFFLSPHCLVIKKAICSFFHQPWFFFLPLRGKVVRGKNSDIYMWYFAVAKKIIKINYDGKKMYTRYFAKKILPVFFITKKNEKKSPATNIHSFDKNIYFFA